MGFQSLPVDLVSALPELPCPIYLERHGRMVLYAMPGDEPHAMLGHAGADLEVHVPTNDMRALRILEVLFKQALESQSGPVGDRGRRVVAFAVALLDPLFGPEASINPTAFAAGQAAVDLLVGALALDPALARAIIGAHTPTGGPKRSSGSSCAPTEARKFAGRALDGLACAITLATTLDPYEADLEGTTLVELGRGVAFRDLGLPRIAADKAGRRTRPGPGGTDAVHGHPALGVKLIAEALGSTPAWTTIVAGHHERLDRSGYPEGIGGVELPRSIRIAGLADSFASLIAPEAWENVRAADEAIGVLRHGAHNRFGDDLVLVLVSLLKSGRLLPMRRGLIEAARR